MPIYSSAIAINDRYGWAVLFITDDPATNNFRSAMPDERTARHAAAGFMGAVGVCEEIVRRAAPSSGNRAEYANGRGTLAGVSLSADIVHNAAAAVGVATGQPVGIVVDRFPKTA